MKRIDYNRLYRSMGIFLMANCGKLDGRAKVTWQTLKEKFGACWESYTNELIAKRIIHGGNGYVYLDSAWAGMTPRERIDGIIKIYPYPYMSNSNEN